MNKKILSDVVKILKHPFGSLEEADAKTWLKYCEDKLLEDYKEYLGAVERLTKAKKGAKA